MHTPVVSNFLPIITKSSHGSAKAEVSDVNDRTSPGNECESPEIPDVIGNQTVLEKVESLVKK
jgi:hypothetical protein